MNTGFDIRNKSIKVYVTFLFGFIACLVNLSNIIYMVKVCFQLIWPALFGLYH